MTMSVKIEGELRYADAATAAAAHAAMLQGRAGNQILEDGARVHEAAIRFAFDDFISTTGAADKVDSAEFGVEKALETAVSGEVVAHYEGERAWKKTALDHPFWQRKWDKAETGFHEGKPNELLVRHVSRFEAKPKMRVLVPLAGKAADLRWLAARGHEVTGVEFVINAIAEFFDEQGLDHWSKARDLGKHKAFDAPGVTMVLGDMFEMRPKELGRFDAIYDRAALVAIEPARRLDYVERCLDLLEPSGHLFLIGMAYDQAKTPGPPWSVDPKTIAGLYETFRVERLETRSIPTGPRMAQAGVPALEESAYLIRR